MFVREISIHDTARHLLTQPHMGFVRQRALVFLVCFSALTGTAVEAGVVKGQKSTATVVQGKKARAQQNSDVKPNKPGLLAGIKTPNALKRLGTKISKRLRLDEGVLELTGTVGTGIPGFASIGVSPKLILSGKKTGNKPVMGMLSKKASVQALVGTFGMTHFPGTKKPWAKSFGAGPFNYTPHDPIHKTAIFGLSIPLIGSVEIGPKFIGAQIAVPVPFAPGVRWGGGVFVSHPALQPVTGRIWKAGEWVGKVGKQAVDGVKSGFNKKFPVTAKRLVAFSRNTKKAIRERAALEAEGLQDVGTMLRSRFEQIRMKLRGVVL